MYKSSERLTTNIAVAVITACLCFAATKSIGFKGYILGFLYAGLVEYAYHRFLNHSKITFFSAKHRLHHMTYHGDNARVANEDATNISEDWYFFPAALIGHVLLSLAVVGYMPLEVMVSFVLFYIQFEVFHWATHIKGNFIDDLLKHIPFIRTLRAEQIIHHLVHHEIANRNYNFTPPYPGDLLMGTETEMDGAERWLQK